MKAEAAPRGLPVTAGTTSSVRLMQMVYRFQMGDPAFQTFKDLYHRSMKVYGDKYPKDFLPLARMLEDSAHSVKPIRAFVRNVPSDKDAWVPPPLEGVRLQFTFVTQNDVFTYFNEKGGLSRWRTDIVLKGIQSGEFFLGQALQVPLVLMRIDPVTPSGEWHGEQSMSIGR